MASPTPVTAVFDIGKTNKKFFLFDRDYSVVHKKQDTLDQAEDEDGDACEDLKKLENWIENNLREAFQNRNVQITSLNFSTYGASLVHLNDKGKPATPLYNYLKPHPKELFNQFYDTYGGKKKLSLQTASPPMGMLNSGFQLYWLKYKKPLKFKEIEYSLHLPQYLSYLLTGNLAAELTSIGCHTALWNFDQNDYHRWLKQEDLFQLLPSVVPVSATQTDRINGTRPTEVGIGIHDSSAALAPFLIALKNPFMLVSTGTWSIAFNPFNDESLTYRELQKDCLCYLDIQGRQVKSSRFFLGNEYMHQKQKLGERFNRKHLQEEMEMDVDLIQKLVREADPAKKLKLGTAYNTGPYPQEKPGDWSIELYSSYKVAYHQLMLDLVAIQAESIQLVQGAENPDKLIITGGFSRNSFFVSLMASFFPDKKIYTSSLSDASALGAAMVIGDEKNRNRDSLENLLGLKQHTPKKGLEINDYTWA